MERIIKRISVEAPQNAYTLYHTYIEFIEQPKLLGSTSYYANLIIKGTKCLIFHFDPGKNNRVGETGLFPVSTSHTTVRTVRYTAVH